MKSFSNEKLDYVQVHWLHLKYSWSVYVHDIKLNGHSLENIYKSNKVFKVYRVNGWMWIVVLWVERKLQDQDLWMASFNSGVWIVLTFDEYQKESFQSKFKEEWNTTPRLWTLVFRDYQKETIFDWFRRSCNHSLGLFISV